MHDKESMPEPLRPRAEMIEEALFENYHAPPMENRKVLIDPRVPEHNVYGDKHVSEQAGAGDLRFYGVVQFFPMLALPLIFVLFRPRRLDGRYLAAMIGFYALAKVFEFFDHAIFEILGQTVSGHSLKHLAAAVAAYLALPMLKQGLTTSSSV